MHDHCLQSYLLCVFCDVLRTFDFVSPVNVFVYVFHHIVSPLCCFARFVMQRDRAASVLHL